MTRYDLSAYFGRVRLRGATRLDFVQRMSSGDVVGLKPGQGAYTCFTTPNGRMVDRALALCQADSLLLLTGGGNQARLIQWLRKYIFFNDDVQLQDETPLTALAGVFGEALPAAIAQAPPHTNVELDGALWIRAALGAEAGAYVVSARALDALAPESDFDALRIAAGAPRFPNELNEGYIPLEAGVWDAVSFKKGCYIGQEIIARMESRNQIAKRLARIAVLEGVVLPGDMLTNQAGGSVTITSAAGAHALGYARGAVTEADAVLVSERARVRVGELVRHG